MPALTATGNSGMWPRWRPGREESYECRSHIIATKALSGSRGIGGLTPAKALNAKYSTAPNPRARRQRWGIAKSQACGLLTGVVSQSGPVAPERPGVACDALPDFSNVQSTDLPLGRPGPSRGLPVITGFLPASRLSLPHFSAFSRNRARGFAKRPEEARISISDRIYAAFWLSLWTASGAKGCRFKSCRAY